MTPHRPRQTDRERERPKRAQHVHTAAVRPIKGKNRKKKRKYKTKKRQKQQNMLHFIHSGERFIISIRTVATVQCPLSIAPEHPLPGGSIKMNMFVHSRGACFDLFRYVSLQQSCWAPQTCNCLSLFCLPLSLAHI